MADDAAAINATTALIKAANEAKTSVLVIVACGIFAILTFWIILKLIEWKKEKDREAEKAKRADQYTGALHALANAFQEHSKAETGERAKLTDSLDNLANVTAKTEQAIGVVLQRTSGQMTRTASLRLVVSTLTGGVCREIAFVVEKSLTENRYEERKSFIANKMRSAMGEILADARQDLRGYPLAMNPDLFFPTYTPEGGGERFTIVDSLWTLIEPLYRKGSPLQERIEESRLLISNAMKDHVARVQAEVTNARVTEGPFRDPASRAITAGDTTPRSTPVIGQGSKFLTPRPGTGNG